MKVTRLDLDGAGSPTALVSRILKIEPTLPTPIPIEQLAIQLEINEIRDFRSEGFVGGLLTDYTRSFGIILVQDGIDRRRRRFTIGHELGHFLIPTHQPAKAGEFLCSKADMLRWTSSEQQRAAQMEAQANEFSSLILMPPPQLRRFVGKSGDPDLAHVLALHEHFDVSKDAAARSYAVYHEQKVAIAVIKEGKILRIYRDYRSFPALTVKPGDRVPKGGAYANGSQEVGALSDVRRTDASLWLDSDWGVRSPKLYDQVLRQRDGFALILLTAEVEEDEDYDPDEARTSKERLRARQDRERH